MKKILLVVIVALSTFVANAQIPMLENVGYVKVGWTFPMGEYYRFKDELKDYGGGHTGLSLNYGSIYYFAKSPITNRLHIGLNVDWVYLTSDYMSYEYNDETNSITWDGYNEELRYAMKIGPSLTFKPNSLIQIDAFLKLNPTLGLYVFEANTNQIGIKNQDGVEFGYGFQGTVGGQLRFSILVVGLEFDLGDIYYEEYDKTVGINDKAGRSTFNLNVGFNF